jgi:8-oxo-dGTP pyrophosphatase MutT (NUDIX family)
MASFFSNGKSPTSYDTIAAKLFFHSSILLYSGLNIIMPKKAIATTRFITLYEDENGSPSVGMGNAAIIVPINSDGLALVHTEPSPAYDGLRAIYVPGGGVDNDEDPALCANREMQEEIGWKAKRVDYLGTVDVATKYVACRVHIYLGRDLEQSQLEGDESAGWIQPHRPIALSEIEALMASGILRDSTTTLALMLARQFLQQG